MKIWKSVISRWNCDLIGAGIRGQRGNKTTVILCRINILKCYDFVNGLEKRTPVHFINFRYLFMASKQKILPIFSSSIKFWLLTTTLDVCCGYHQVNTEAFISIWSSINKHSVIIMWEYFPVLCSRMLFLRADNYIVFGTVFRPWCCQKAFKSFQFCNYIIIVYGQLSYIINELG